MTTPVEWLESLGQKEHLAAFKPPIVEATGALYQIKDDHEYVARSGLYAGRCKMCGLGEDLIIIAPED